MIAEEITRLIRDHTSLSPDTLSHLNSLTKEYPFFQTGRILYVLNLHQVKDTRFPAELRKMACHAGDRKALFYLVEGDSFLSLNTGLSEKKEGQSMNSRFELIDFFLMENAGKTPNKIRREETLSNKSQVSTDYLSFFLSEETKKQDSESVPMQYQEAIDQFLEEDRKFPIRIELRETGGGGAEPSLESDADAADENGFFSETLAKIYLKQKKYEKALEIIRKLNLVYPEKNIYFADQIRFLEKLIINVKKT